MSLLGTLYRTFGWILWVFCKGYPLSHLSTSSTLKSNLPVALLHFNEPTEIARKQVLFDKLVWWHTSDRLNHLVVPPVLIRDFISFKISSIRNSI